MHWDVVFSEQIEDYAIEKKLGFLNLNDEKDVAKGLNSLVNARIRGSEWSVPPRSRVIHGIEGGSEVYAQELIFIDEEGKMPHWSYSNEEIYKVVSAPTLLSSNEEKIGLIGIVNKELSQGWSLGRYSSFDYCRHNSEPCWHIRLFGPSFGGVKT